MLNCLLLLTAVKMRINVYYKHIRYMLKKRAGGEEEREEREAAVISSIKK
jgi:hypothetical protein